MRSLFLAAFVALSLNSLAQPCVVDWNTIHQRIDGFGASSAFSGSTWTSSQANMFFSTNTGIGLSLLRMQVQPQGFTHANEIALAQMAQNLGARVWATPWTPPAAYKSNDNTNGGSFVSTYNHAYANLLAGYVAKLTNNSIHLYALSIQNEPDAVVSYVSCYWSAQQYHDFVPYLYNALASSNVGSTKIMLPECESWYDTNYETTAMNDPSTAAQVGILAYHNYDGSGFDSGPTSVPDAQDNYGKSLWETEVSTGDNYDGSISNAIYWAGRIHLFMTVAQANAWHYWWLIALSTDNQGLTDSAGTPAKRMYALGQYSRFVRPNYNRIDANAAGSAAEISAYKDSASPSFAIVAINPTASTISQVFSLTNFTAATVTPWLTSATASLTKQAAVSVSDAAFTYHLPAMSVMTFVGQALTSNSAPVLTTVPAQEVNPGETLLVTNSAIAVSGVDLTFSLINPPTNATIDAPTGLFSWRAPVADANSVITVMVKVADSGNPSLSDTNSFKILVNALTLPTFSSISVQPGNVTLTVTGSAGPDYTLSKSSDLKNWQVILETNSPALPLVLEDTNTSQAESFYRIQIGP